MAYILEYRYGNGISDVSQSDTRALRADQVEV